MDEEDTALTRQISTLIRDHLRSHPDAGDTVTGIRRFWLPADLHCRDEDVERTVKALCASNEMRFVAGIYRGPARPRETGSGDRSDG